MIFEEPLEINVLDMSVNAIQIPSTKEKPVE